MKKEHAQAPSFTKALEECVKQCRACCNVSVECRSGCSTKKALKCSSCFEKAYIVIEDCIKAAKGCLDALKKHLEECGNQTCNTKVQALIQQCHAVINACQNTVKMCRHDQDGKPCLDAWRSCIKQSAAFIELQ